MMFTKKICFGVNFLTILIAAYSVDLSASIDMEKLRTFKEQQLLTDVVLVAKGGKEFPCHKLMLAARSTFFEKKFITEGPQQKKIILMYSPETIKTFLDFIYEDNSDEIIKKPVDWDIYLELQDFATEASVKDLENVINQMTVKVELMDVQQEFGLLKFREKSLIDRIFATLPSIQPVALSSSGGQHAQISFMAFKDDGAKLVTASYDKTAKVWNDQCELLATLSGHEGYVNSAAWSRDGTKIATGSSDKTIRIWDEYGHALITLFGQDHPVESVAFSPDGKSIATVSRNNTLKVWDILDKKEVFSRRYDVFNVVAFSPDGLKILAPSHNMAKILSAGDGNEIVSLHGHTAQITSIAWNYDGKIVTGSVDGRIRLWDENGGILPSPWAEKKALKYVRLTSDGKKLITIDLNNRIKFSNTDGEEIFNLAGSLSYGGVVAISSDGTKIAMASNYYGFKILFFPPQELYDNQALLASKNVKHWLLLKYRLAHYLKTLNNGEPNYHQFTENDPYFIEVLEQLMIINTGLKSYLQAVFKF